MASVTSKKSAPVPAEPPTRPEPLFLRAIDEIYRFLASLKLAVISISALAAVLAFGTFFESSYGTPAVQQYVYRSPLFALLLAFLGINIFCAATIRFPWKRRQTGFVITHAGLLIVLLGAFISVRFSDEGQVGMAEGASSDRLVRTEHAVVRIQPIDVRSGEPGGTMYQLPFLPGSFAWRQGTSLVFALRVATATLVALLVAWVLAWRMTRPSWAERGGGVALMLGLLSATVVLGYFAMTLPNGRRRDVLTDGNQPFKLAMKDFLPSSTPLIDVHEPGPNGVPMLRLALLAQPPGAPTATDNFNGRGWLEADDPLLLHGALNTGPARIGFQYAPRDKTAQLLDDFFHPPAEPLKQEVARLHYNDKDGKDRVYAWEIASDHAAQIAEGGKLAKPGKSVVLPDSDLTVTLLRTMPLAPHGQLPPEMARLLAQVLRATGERQIHAAIFQVKKGNGREVVHIGFDGLPLFPSALSAEGDPESAELVHISYFHPPLLTPAGQGMMMGRKGVIEVLATESGKFYARAFNAEGLKLPPREVKLGEVVKTLGGDKMPMQISIRLDELLKSGTTRQVCEPLELPKSEREKSIAACLVEMTVGETTREFWVRYHWSSLGNPFADDPNALEVPYRTIDFPGKRFQIAYDSDRRELPFTLKLKDFEPGKDPGAESAATYRSDVLLTDRDEGIVEEPRVITMNEPLTHRGWTFYQSRYSKGYDPDTGDRDGLYLSFFQVHYDPAWKIVYSGCLLVVIGTFVQFYMRAGVFTDGGKKERERAEAKAVAASPQAKAKKKQKAGAASNGAAHHDL